MNSRLLTIALVASLFVLVQLAASSKDLIDLESLLELNSTENDLCKHGNKRIARISTIPKLLEHFKAIEDLNCREKWLKPLEDLQEVLMASERDACSLDTVDKIESFHWNYVVGTLAWSWRKASNGTIPEPLKLFFLHFSDEITQRCKSSLGDRLTEAIGDSPAAHLEAKSLSGGSFGAKINTLSIALIPQSEVKRFEDFFFIFNSIINMERKKGEPLTWQIDPITGEVVYVSLKVRNATSAYEIQHKCKQEMRPVYFNTVLPLMKLIDLGYGNKGEDIGQNDLIANWYSITQLCQLILPIKFYTNQDLNSDQVSLVSEEEAKVLENPHEEMTSLAELPINREIKPIELEDILTGAADDRVAGKVKSNFQSRGRIYRMMFKNVLIAIKAEIQSKIMNIFVSKKTENNEFVPEKNDAVVAASLNEADKLLKEDELRDKELDSSKSLERVKRDGFHRVFERTMFWMCGVGLVAILIFMIAFVILAYAG